MGGQTSSDGEAGAVLAEVSLPLLHRTQDQEEELETSPPGHPQKPAQEEASPPGHPQEQDKELEEASHSRLPLEQEQRQDEASPHELSRDQDQELEKASLAGLPLKQDQVQESSHPGIPLE